MSLSNLELSLDHAVQGHLQSGSRDVKLLQGKSLMTWIQIMRKIYTLLFFVFETGSCYAAQAGPELTILLSQPQYSDSRCERPCLASLHQLLKSCIKEAVSEKSRQLTSTTDLSKPTFSWFKFFFITQKDLICHYHKSHLKSTTTTVFGILDWVCHESCNLSDTTFLRGTMMSKKTKQD